MISLLPLCTLLAPAASADEGLYGGASVGAFSGTFSPLGVGGAVHPRFGAWIHPNLALEAEVAAGLGGDFTAVGPLLQARFAPWEDATIRPFVVSGPGVLVTSSDLTTRSPAFAWDTGLGAMFALGDRVDLRVDGRYLVAMGRDEAELFDVDGHTELLFGIDIGFGNLTRDSDKDGLADDVDACIDDAEDMDGFEDTDGCPEADNDNDGLPDLVDSCPMDAEDVDGFADTDGCPDNDNDSDGVADVDDSCPTEAGVAALAGCPDGDGDGVADAKDLCPTEPGKANAGGCPDRDGDRVPDARDKCPDEAASKRIDPRRSDGCPSRVVVTAEAIEITETVYFDSGRATIQNRSHGLLDDVAKVLNTYTDITKVEVAGHTDSSGNDDANMTLSENRAAAVVTYLTEKGSVDAGRLEAKGYGETKPVADNDTSEGKAKNRRVEFVILEQAQTKTVVPATDTSKPERKSEE